MATGIVPAWRTALLAALEQNSHHKFTIYCQLATVRPDGRPANRTVVYRGFVEGTDSVHFWTDTRSSKVEDIAHNPWGEVCWYFVDTWEQFRLTGRLHVIGPNEPAPSLAKLRAQAWQGTSARQKAQFGSPPPRQPRAPQEALPAEIDETLGPLPAFGLLTLEPVQVDYLHLKANRRILHTKGDSKEWGESEVNP